MEAGNRRRPARRARRLRAGTHALVAGAAVLVAAPAAGFAVGDLGGAVRSTVDRVDTKVKRAVAPAGDALDRRRPQHNRRTVAAAPAAASPAPVLRAEDPKTQPPLHGTNPHGQGTVAVIDLAPEQTRPAGGSPTGSDSGEEVVVGRARGEQRADGSYHGHITIAALFGQEILGVDTEPGQTKAGPLDAVQQGILTPLCDGSGKQICLSLVRADSSTTENGSTNHFSAAHATLGGANGIDVGAAESNGNISEDEQCQTAHGDSRVASAKVGGQAVADVAQSSTTSKACRGQEPTQTNSSSVIGLLGSGVPVPAAGCGDGTADTQTGIPTIAPIVCNADDANSGQAESPYGTRDALTVFLLDAGGPILAKAMTAGAESKASAPKPECSDGADNDGDGATDAGDPGCLSGPGNSYNPNDDDETNAGGATACSDGADNDGDGVSDAADPGCHTDGDAGNPASYDPSDTSEADGDGSDGGAAGRGDGETECSDGADNDGDGLADRADPGCHSDGDAGNPASYVPADDDESDRGTTASGVPACSNGLDDDGDGRTDHPDDAQCSSPSDDSESDVRTVGAGLPFTGTNALLTAIAGLLMLGGGVELRRRMRRTGGPA